MIGSSPLGLALSNALMSGSKSANAEPSFAPPAPQGLSKGQLIMGVLADALAGAAGRPGAFAAQQGQQRQMDREMAQWTLQRKAGLEDFETRQRIDQKYAKPAAPYRWEANDGSLMEIGADGSPRVVYKDPTPKTALDPDVFTTLPDGRFYAGPRSGIAEALMGGAPPAAGSPKPVGKLTPIAGGPAATPGSFR